MKLDWVQTDDIPVAPSGKVSYQTLYKNCEAKLHIFRQSLIRTLCLAALGNLARQLISSVVWSFIIRLIIGWFSKKIYQDEKQDFHPSLSLHLIIFRGLISGESAVPWCGCRPDASTTEICQIDVCILNWTIWAVWGEYWFAVVSFFPAFLGGVTGWRNWEVVMLSWLSGIGSVLAFWSVFDGWPGFLRVGYIQISVQSLASKKYKYWTWTGDFNFLAFAWKPGSLSWSSMSMLSSESRICWCLC